jgi:nitrous oxide reductase accessory protein NosL
MIKTLLAALAASFLLAACGDNASKKGPAPSSTPSSAPSSAPATPPSTPPAEKKTEPKK